MKIRIFTLIIILCVMFSINLFAGIQDKCGTTSGSSAPYIPTSGNIKVLVIFAQFKDDIQITHNGWAKDSFPDWGSTFVNSSPGGTYPWNNLSHYYNEMSNGTFQVYGDVYGSLVTTDKNQSEYNNIGEVNREIILEIDPFVNFANYDILNGNSFGSDGKVDFIYIIYRNVTGNTLMYYTGIAQLNLSQTITADGKQIVDYSSIDPGGGVQLRGGYNGRDYTLYVAAHEMGHYLFGGNHIDFVSNHCLMSGLPVWNASRGMHSWERQKLGWISFTDKSTDGSVTISDYMTSDQVYRVPINSSEYFLIENRRKLSSHDQVGDTGFYIYKITGATSFPPAIDVLCADGNWNFNFDTSTLTITRLTQNPSSTTDEMNIYYFHDSNGDGWPELYSCYTPVYYENAAWGDNKDAFDLTFNNVLSPVSNPRSTNVQSTNFTIQVTGENTLTFYFTDPYAGSPSKPQNVRTSGLSGEPTILWDANKEPDISSYKVYRSINNGSYQLIADNVTGTSATDNLKSIIGTIQNVKYKIIAKDSQNLLSVYSEPTTINFTQISGGTISSNTSWSGNIIVTGNVTVTSGATLTINSGTQIYFSGGAYLSITNYGTLTANGTSASPILFDFISSNATTQNGIKFNSSSMGTINYCQIRNAYRGIYENNWSINVTNTAISGCFYGIYLSGSSPTIQYCNIHDNTNAGIYLINYSSPNLYNNYMTNNYYGVYCTTNSSPKFGSGSTQGKNRLSNYCGVYCWNNSLPVLGKSSPLDGGYNNLENASQNIYNVSSGTVYAHHIWWGTTNPANFLISGSDPTQYNNYLPSSVIISPTPPLSKTSGGLYASEKDEIPMLSELDKAYELVASNNLSEARAVCMNLINNYPDYSVSYNALNLLKETYTDKEATSKSNIYKTLFKEKGKKDLYAMAGLLLSDIDKENKLKHIDEVIEKYKGEKVIELALFDKFVYYYFDMEDEKSARTISDELDAQFTKSIGAIEAHKILGDEEYLKLNWELQPEEETAKQVTDENKFVLDDNYPNPFNPTTVINFLLPQETHVTLKVYDILGQEVAVLVSELKPAGEHKALFNAKELPSGVYIYTLKAGAYNSVKKMLLVK